MYLHFPNSQVVAVCLLDADHAEIPVPEPDFCLQVHILQVRHRHLYTSLVFETKHIPNQKDDLSTSKSALLM